MGKSTLRIAILTTVCAITVLSPLGCCALEKQAIDALGRTQDLINIEYIAYVDSDAKLDAKAKRDRKDLIETERKLREALKR